MGQTVLSMVQNILSSLDGDEVNSISDTTESRQVAQILQNKYLDMANRGALPEHRRLLQLDPSLDETRPTLMNVPESINKIDWIKYFDSSTADSTVVSQFGAFHHDLNTDLVQASSISSLPPAGYKYVTIIPLEQFLDQVNRFNPSESNVKSYSFNEPPYNFTLYYKNDRQPQFCAILENDYVLFDTYNSNFDSTLQASKTMCYGQTVPPFQLTDSFIPDIDGEQFSLLLNEAKAWAWLELRQMPHPKAEQETKRQWSTVQKNKSVTNRPTYFNELPNMGRVPRTGGYSSGGYGAYKWMRQSGP